jgi:hypothetical protein
MLVVFVHLGANPSPCLNEMAKIAQHHSTSAQVVLVTDKPELHPHFPGGIVEYIRKTHNPWFDSFAKRRKELSEIAGGYWSHTLERLFALTAVYEVMGDSMMVHVESDVYLNLERETLSGITRDKSRILVPRYSSELGIASVLIVRDRNVLRDGLTELQRILIEDVDLNNDMNLLGAALKLGVVEELPSNPNFPIVLEKRDLGQAKFIFDGAALGQYFFGQDPFHTDGRRISGYVNADAKFDSSGFHYEIRKSYQNKQNVLFVNDVEVLNLHVHSKLKLSPADIKDLIWERSVKEANHQIDRKQDDFRPDVIHTQQISFVNRFRIARRRGFLISTVKAIHRRVIKALGTNE